MNKSKVTAKKSKSGKTLEILIPTKAVNSQMKKKSKKNKRAKRSISSDLVQSFIAAQRYPDLVGPMRYPRYGGSDRTGLAMDRARIVITGSATLTVQGVQAGTGFYGSSCANTFSVLAINTALAAGTPVVPGAAFPPSTSIADINQTATSIVVSYTGAPLNATGEVLLGCSIPIATTATYNSLYFYPGTLKFTVADLVNNPQRVCLRKLSPAASEFIPLGTNQADLDLPFVMTSGLPTGGTLNVEVCRTFEFRSTTADALVVPYEKAAESFTLDSNAYQDAQALIAETPYAVSPGLPGTEDQGYIPYYGQMARTVGVGSVASALTGLLMQGLRTGRHRGNHPFGRVNADLV